MDEIFREARRTRCEEEIKIWIAVDRRYNKIVAHQITKDSDKKENITCKKLLNEVIYG